MPDLADSPTSIFNMESAIDRVQGVGLAHNYVLDLRLQTRISPWGVLAMLHFTRALEKKSGTRVKIVNIPNDVHSYLERIDFFAQTTSWVDCSQPLQKQWSATSNSSNLLEVRFVRGISDVNQIAARAENIFGTWLNSCEIGRLVTIFSELCGNIYKHSGDSCGCVTAQKYEMSWLGCVRVCICVADLGVGIRSSLSQCHPNLPPKESDCFKKVLHGMSARGPKEASMGLRSAADIAQKSGGYFALRSNTARLTVGPDPKRIEVDDGLTHFSGTQLTIEFRAPLRN